MDHCRYSLPGEYNTSLLQVCTSDDTSHFEKWFETTVRPSFIITADDVEKVSEEMLEKLSEGETDVLKDVLGLAVSCSAGASWCFNVDSVVNKSLAHVRRVRPDWAGDKCPNWALDTSNGRPFSFREFARQLKRLRAVGSSSSDSSLSKAPTDLEPADRVRATLPIRYCATSDGEWVQVTDATIPEFIV